MQEKMTYVGQLDCYGRSNEILFQMLNVDVSAMQVHRVTDTNGALLEEQVMTEQAPACMLSVKEGESVYAMVDGSMVLTREKSWAEVKLGRIFKATDCMESSPKHGWIRDSVYEAYLGNHRTFTRRFEQKLDYYIPLKEKLIFITDGAAWIKKWIEDAYPDATQVLDFYHACEHLCDFAKEYFDDEVQKNDWVDKQKSLLFDSGVQQVIANIELLPVKRRKAKIRSELLHYYQTNKDRMDYRKYKKMGAGLIGSGPIESAHRTVIQKRMKQSGQRWTIRRAQNMLTLRCTDMSGNWNKLIELLKPTSTMAA